MKSKGIASIILVMWILTAVVGIHAWRRWDFIPPKIVRKDTGTMQVYTVYDEKGRPKEASFTVIESTKAFQK